MIPFSRPSEWLHVEGTCHEVGHTWIKSCVLANIELVLIVSYEGFKVYFPFYLVSPTGRLHVVEYMCVCAYVHDIT